MRLKRIANTRKRTVMQDKGACGSLTAYLEELINVMKMDWIYLFIAAMFEMGWAIGLKYTEGFTHLWPSVFTILGTISSFFFLSMAVRNLPIGTAYAVWTGIGTVGTVLFGIFFLGEPKDLTRVVCILLIVAGIVGLKVTSE